MQTVSGRRDPVVRAIGRADIAEAFGKGLRDLQAAPLYGLAVGLLYAAGGMLIVAFVLHLNLAYLIYPLAAGFALLGPFAAIGLYEISRRREAGEPLSFGAAFGAMRRRGEIGWMAFVTLFVFIIWMYQVRLLLALFLGINANFATLGQFITVVLTTGEGLMFLAVGNVVGAVLALTLFSLTVVSFPLLLDREVDFVTAMITSVKAVTTSPGPLLGWGVIVVLVLIASALPFFVGLIFTLPVLGHTTWHLYRRVVEPLSEPGAGTGT